MGSDKPDYTLGISILEQALANLTAVVTATALDIRALNPLDLAHEGLPYNYEILTYFLDASCDDNDSDDKGFSHSDWGAGKDFYPITLTFSFGWSSIFTNNIFINHGQAIGIDLFEILAGGGDDPVVLRENITPFSHPPIKVSTAYYTRGTFTLNKNKIDAGNTLLLRLTNESGGNLGTGAIEITIMGMAV